MPVPVEAGGIPDSLLERLSIFVLAGQSNMSGYAALPARRQSHPRVFLFGNDYRWKLAREPLDDASGQVDEVSRDEAAGFGPGLEFAMSLMQRDSTRVLGLVPCAMGGSSIHEWRRSLSENELYGSCLKRVRAATTIGDVTGLLFFQGEADAADPTRAGARVVSPSNYADLFTAFLSDFRRDVAEPLLPVVFAQIGTHTAPDYFVNWELVREQQSGVSLRCVAMITTDDLPLGDAVHYNVEAYRIIGQRFAEAFAALVRDGC